MNSKKNLFTLFSITAMLLLSLGAATQIQAQQTRTSFSGQAVGLIASANILGETVVPETRIADTKLQNVSGTGNFNKTKNVANAKILFSTDFLPPREASSVITGVIDTMTSGGPANGNTSQSSATVNGLDFDVIPGGILTGPSAFDISADTVTSTSFCTCGVCSGTTTIENLTLTNSLQQTFVFGGTGRFGIPIPGATVTTDANGNIFLTFPPNTTLSLLGGVVVLTFNEQTSNSANIADITVNALHIAVNLPLGGGTVDTIVSQAHSDITCLRPTAASVTVRGRVLSPYGRGVSRARVIMTDSTGQTRTAMTNPFGYYSFTDVEAGGTYIFEVRDKRYVFTPQALSLTEEVTNFNFTAQQ